MITYSQGVPRGLAACNVVNIFPCSTAFSEFHCNHAKQAGWFAPVSFIVFIPVIYMLMLLQKYKDESFIGIMDDICGRIPKDYFIFILYGLQYLQLYLRYYSERLLTTILPHVSNFCLFDYDGHRCCNAAEKCCGLSPDE